MTPHFPASTPFANKYRSGGWILDLITMGNTESFPLAFLVCPPLRLPVLPKIFSRENEADLADAQ